MEFLKNKWAYLLLAAALALMIGASVYLYVICRGREPYVGGMLVEMGNLLPAGIRALAGKWTDAEWFGRLWEMTRVQTAGLSWGMISL